MPASWFTRAGDLQAAYEAVDWAATPLGPPQTWSTTLWSTLDLAWSTRFAVTLFWGPEQVLLYNNAYVPLIADKHPTALGALVREVFPEVIDTIGPMISGVAEGGATVWVQDAHLPLRRRGGQLDDAWFTFSYSAVRGPTGDIEGVIDIATETTEQVLSSRRLAVLAQVTAALAGAEDGGDVASAVIEQGVRALGCDGGALLVPADAPGGARALATSSTGTDHLTDLDPVDHLDRAALATLLEGGAGYFTRADAHSPWRRAEHDTLQEGTRQATDQAADRAADEATPDALSEESPVVAVALAMSVDGAPVGVLLATWDSPRLVHPAVSTALQALAAQGAQGLQRLQARQAEQAGLMRIAQVTESMAVGYLAMDAGWRITYVNTEAVTALGLPREQLLGGLIWELFPATVGTDFEAGYRRAADSGEQVVFDAYYPEPLNAWYEVRATPEADGVALYFINITERRHAQAAIERASAQVAALGRSALVFSQADDVPALALGMAEQSVAVLGADGAGVALPQAVGPHEGALQVGALEVYVSANLSDQVRTDYARLPTDAALPIAVAARTGRPVMLGDQEASEAFSEDLATANTATGCQAWAALPLRADGGVIGAVALGWAQPQTFTAEQVALLETFTTQCAQALARLSARQAERHAAQAALTSAQQQAALVAIAQALAAADTRDDVLDVLADQGSALLGANGCGLCLRSPSATLDPIVDGPSHRAADHPSAGAEDSAAGSSSQDLEDVWVDTIVTDTYAQVRHTVQRVPADFPLPAIRSAATGQAIFMADQDTTEAAFPGSRQIYNGAGVQASAALPLLARGRLLGCLSVGFSDQRHFSDAEQELLAAFAALTAQALERISAHTAEQAALAAAAGIAETLQRSMLTAPPEPDHLQIAVRYAAAADHAEVGGDWYDAFLTKDGVTSLVIGDVTGHDMRAASIMGQLRNLLRGLGFTLGEPPARVLAAVDRAAAGLGIETVATAIVAQIEVDDAHRAAGTRLLRWSNAGHLPPLLLEADGTAKFLEGESDLVLGWDPSIDRHDHEHVLQPGSTVLLYTDGLVERRGVNVERGLAWLAEAAAELAGSPGVTLEELCDALVELVGDHLDDDVALLALRAHPEDEPRPAEAGPVQLPARLDEAAAAAAQQADS